MTNDPNDDRATLELSDSDRIRSLEERLYQLEAANQIRNLKAEYGMLVDDRYTRRGPREGPELDALAERIGELFTEDAIWDGGAGLGRCEGRAAIIERMRKPTLQFSWHYFVKPNIRVMGREANATWDLLAPCTTANGQAMWMSGTEHDQYRFVGDRWLHSDMKLRVVFLAPHETGWARSPR